MQHQQRSGIRADPVEGRMPKRKLPRIPDNDVKAQGQHGKNTDHNDNMQQIIIDQLKHNRKDNGQHSRGGHGRFLVHTYHLYLVDLFAAKDARRSDQQYNDQN